MNRARYLRRLGARVPRRARARAVEAADAELRALEQEALDEGHAPEDATKQAIRLHRSAEPGRTPWHFEAVLTAPFRSATWKGALYLALLFPLGLAAGIWASAGLAVVAGLSVIGIGLLLVVPFLLSLRPIAQTLGVLARWATGQPMPMLGTVPRSEGTLLARIRVRLQDPETFVAWAMCIVAFILGQVALAWLAGIGSAVVYLLGAPFITALPPMPGGGAVYPRWLADAALLKLVVGVLGLWVWCWGCQALAWTSARITRGVLTRT